ncbi:MAG: hypothetical protein NUV97_00015, partial [archaeon]|nr:hypothetical protein [archaeon]
MKAISQFHINALHYAERETEFIITFTTNRTGLSLFEENNYNIHFPIQIHMQNALKFGRTSSSNIQSLSRDLHYHWVTDFIHLQTKEQLIRAIKHPETCASLATTIALNRYIIKNACKDNEIKQILQGSPWRWIYTAQHEYVQQTFYGKTNVQESRAGHLLFSTNAISSLVSFSYWLQNEIQREQ